MKTSVFHFLIAVAVLGLLASSAAGAVRLAQLIQGDVGLPDAHRSIERRGLLVAAACASFIGMAVPLPSL